MQLQALYCHFMSQKLHHKKFRRRQVYLIVSYWNTLNASEMALLLAPAVVETNWIRNLTSLV